MKTTLDGAAVAKAIGAVKGLVERDATHPFSRVRVDAAGANVSFTATNGSVQVEYIVRGETAESGTVALLGQQLARFASGLPGGKVEIAGKEGGVCKISAPGVSFTLSDLGWKGCATMAAPSSGMSDATIDQDVLRDMLRKTVYAASRDETRKALLGVNMCLVSSRLEMTATDGRRLAHVEADVETAPAATFDVTLPVVAAAALHGLLDGNGRVYVSSDGKTARFVEDRFAFTCKAREEKFPNWTNVVPKEYAHEATIRRGAFLEALGRAALAADANGCVEVSVGDKKAVFRARSNYGESVAETEYVSVPDGGVLKSRFDARLLREALSSVDTVEFRLGFGDQEGPVVLRNGSPWMAVVMPMRKM